MLDKNNIQVKEGYYKKNSYNSLERFISYFYQIDSIHRLADVTSILEIGPGSKLVSDELIKEGYKVTTTDFDPTVNPDVVSDVRDLPFDPHSFDCIMACQILEHIPYSEFEKVIADFARMSTRYVIISLPERHSGINIITKIPFIQTLFKRKFFDLSIRIPTRFPGFEESGQHYWEIDYFTISLKKVRTTLGTHFNIVKEFNPPLNKYHHFFILEKK